MPVTVFDDEAYKVAIHKPRTEYDDVTVTKRIPTTTTTRIPTTTYETKKEVTYDLTPVTEYKEDRLSHSHQLDHGHAH